MKALLARTRASALAQSGDLGGAERFYRLAIELGSGRREEEAILDLYLAKEDFPRFQQLLTEFKSRMSRERFRLFRAIGLALQGQLSADAPDCFPALTENERFARALLAHAMGHPDAPELLKRVFEREKSEWKRRKVESLLLNLQGPSVCSFCQKKPAVRLWVGEKPLCAECGKHIDNPETITRWVHGEEDPETMRVTAWIGGPTNLRLPKASNQTLPQLSEEQLFHALPEELRNRLQRPFSMGVLARAITDEYSGRLLHEWQDERISELLGELQSWPEDEAEALWALQAAQWISLFNPHRPSLEITPDALWTSVRMLIPNSPNLWWSLTRACRTVWLLSKRLPAEATNTLRELLTARPSDLILRCMLLGSYAPGNAHRQELGLWFIRNHPAFKFTRDACSDAMVWPAFYVAAVEAWSDQISNHNENPSILGNAASFFTPTELELAEELYLRCMELEPQNAEWSEQLAHVLQLGDRDVEGLSRALSLLEDSLAMQGSEKREYLLTSMVQIAVDAGEDQKAKLWAHELIDGAKPGWNQGNALHHAQLALGILSLRAGDLEEAGRHLVRSAQVPTTPQLGSFGPNMRLAQALLQLGCSKPVLAYLEECKTLWKSGEEQLQEWVDSIKDGAIPEFGANLNY